MTLRLDQALVARNLVDSRNRAQQLIHEGSVLINGVVARKPATPVRDADQLRITAAQEYVSRGAYKLLEAFRVFGVAGLQAQGTFCLDIGASTGGFTQVLLEQGASSVIALDVGHGQLHQSLINNSRVIVINGVNIRAVTRDSLPFAPSVIVSDVSFISLTYVLPRIALVAAPQAHVMLLVKPQFEVGKGKLNKHGIVESEELRLQALAHIEQEARELGMRIMASAPSPILGTHGNKEYLLYLRTK